MKDKTRKQHTVLVVENTDYIVAPRLGSRLCNRLGPFPVLFG